MTLCKITPRKQLPTRSWCTAYLTLMSIHWHTVTNAPIHFTYSQSIHLCAVCVTDVGESTSWTLLCITVGHNHHYSALNVTFSRISNQLVDTQNWGIILETCPKYLHSWNEIISHHVFDNLSCRCRLQCWFQTSPTKQGWSDVNSSLWPPELMPHHFTKFLFFFHGHLCLLAILLLQIVPFETNAWLTELWCDICFMSL